MADGVGPSRSNDKPIPVKLAFFGEAAVGKSSIVLRFVSNDFQANKEATIGAAFITQNCRLEDCVLRYEIWDIAGQARFYSLAPMYYRNAQAAVVVYDVTKASSFDKAKSWVKELQRQTHPNIVIALAGNKIDLVTASSRAVAALVSAEDEKAGDATPTPGKAPESSASMRQVPKNEAQAYASEAGLLFFETSAKTGEGIMEIFTEIAMKIPFEHILDKKTTTATTAALANSGFTPKPPSPAQISKSNQLNQRRSDLTDLDPESDASAPVSWIGAWKSRPLNLNSNWLPNRVTDDAESPMESDESVQRSLAGTNGLKSKVTKVPINAPPNEASSSLGTGFAGLSSSNPKRQDPSLKKTLLDESDPQEPSLPPHFGQEDYVETAAPAALPAIPLSSMEPSTSDGRQPVEHDIQQRRPLDVISPLPDHPLNDTVVRALAELEHLRIDPCRWSYLPGYPLTIGGFGIVRAAKLDDQIMAIKELRITGADAERARFSIRFARELKVWSLLDHPNLLKLSGFYMDPEMSIAQFICPFIAHGHIRNFIEAHRPDQDSRLRLAEDTALGLQHLHGLRIAHGDLKELNVLVDPGPRALLCDYGLANMVNPEGKSGLTTTGMPVSLRFASPEILNGARPGLASDIWAWACLFLKITTDMSPYGDTTDLACVTKIVQGNAPIDVMALNMPANVQNMLLQCWKHDPLARPSIVQCRDVLHDNRNINVVVLPRNITNSRLP